MEAARGLAPAFAHAQSLADRPLTHQLDNTASNIGLTTTVLRKAVSENRIKQFRRHPDDVVSVQILGKEVAAKERAATPASEQSSRLMYGDTAMVSALEDNNFIIVRTTDGQLNRWRFPLLVSPPHGWALSPVASQPGEDRPWENRRWADRLQHDSTRRSTQMQRSGLRPKVTRSAGWVRLVPCALPGRVLPISSSSTA